MSENTVAIRCKSEMNRWMDSVMVVPQEQADDIEQNIKERMRGFERNGSCYGDVMREIAQAAGIESLALCDYDEDTDEPTDAWCEYCAGLSQKMPVIEIDLGELGNDVNIDDLLDKAEELGWCIHESDTEWEFIQNSPAGEDFSFDVGTDDVHNADDMVREIRSYANGFDAEEHAKMWIEAQGWVSGVPDLKTLVKDADDIKLMLNKLASAMEDVLQGESDDEDDRAELSPRQIERLDEIDNAMYRFLLVLLEQDEDEFDWDMYHIGEAVDAVQQVMLDHGFDIHRPYIEDDGERRTVHDYERAGDR